MAETSEMADTRRPFETYISTENVSSGTKNDSRLDSEGGFTYDPMEPFMNTGNCVTTSIMTHLLNDATVM